MEGLGLIAAEQQLDRIVNPGGGANQTRVRAYNERLVMSLVRRHGSLPKAEIAKRSGLSPQTVSVIMRALEQEGLLLRGNPVRGKVGQPSIPMSLNPDAAYSIGLKIGRRSAECILLDFLGRKRLEKKRAIAYPMPDATLRFAEDFVGDLTGALSAGQRERIVGIGVAMPFELWNWADKVGAPQGDMEAWRNLDIQAELEKKTGFPVFLQNDATAACSAELVFGRGAQHSDFVYFFIGTFAGGGIVLNHSVHAGHTGNAGALGSMPVPGLNGRPAQLIDFASIHTLETMVNKAGGDASPIWTEGDDWPEFDGLLDEWAALAARQLAFAITAACSVIDFEAAIIDGAFPADVRRNLVDQTRRALSELNTQGLADPAILEGRVGPTAKVVGGASLALSCRFLLDQNVLF